MKTASAKLVLKSLFATLVLASTATTTYAYGVDCSQAAIRQRSQEMTLIRNEAQQSYDLKYIDRLIVKLDQLYAAERICLRANLSTMDGPHND